MSTRPDLTAAAPDAAVASTVATAPADTTAVVARLSTVDRFLPVWIGAAMVAGLLLGRLVPGLGAALDAVKVGQTSLPIAIGLLLPRAGRGPGRPQRDLPGPHLRRARLLLPQGAARLARVGDHGPGRVHVEHRQDRPDLPRHPTGRRVPPPHARRAPPRPGVVRDEAAANDRADRALRPAVHGRCPVRPPGPDHHLSLIHI